MGIRLGFELPVNPTCRGTELCGEPNCAENRTVRGTELPGLKRKDPRWERGLRGGERGFASSAPGGRSSAKRWRTGRPVAGQEQRCSRARLGPAPTAGTKWVGRLFRERQARRNHDPGRSSGFRCVGKFVPQDYQPSRFHSGNNDNQTPYTAAAPQRIQTVFPIILIIT